MLLQTAAAATLLLLLLRFSRRYLLDLPVRAVAAEKRLGRFGLALVGDLLGFHPLILMQTLFVRGRRLLQSSEFLLKSRRSLTTGTHLGKGRSQQHRRNEETASTKLVLRSMLPLSIKTSGIFRLC